MASINSVVKPVNRKSEVFGRPTLPCLSGWRTINLLAGCPYECVYCYARSFRSYPGNGKVIFYENSFDLVKDRLLRMRKKPTVVYFSTACEPFVPHNKILETLFNVMELLLKNEISILVSTKSLIPETFIRLFSGYPGKVFIQVGLTTADDEVRRVLEPHASSVDERSTSLQRLVEAGIGCEIRMDPLIPELTDDTDSFTKLCRHIKECGARTAAASHLFLRRTMPSDLHVDIGNWSFSEMAHRVYVEKIENYCGNASIRIPSAGYRRHKHVELKQIAKQNGIDLRLCRCKNPDVTTDCCHPKFQEEQPQQLSLIT